MRKSAWSGVHDPRVKATLGDWTRCTPAASETGGGGCQGAKTHSWVWLGSDAGAELSIEESGAVRLGFDAGAELSVEESGVVRPNSNELEVELVAAGASEASHTKLLLEVLTGSPDQEAGEQPIGQTELVLDVEGLLASGGEWQQMRLPVLLRTSYEASRHRASTDFNSDCFETDQPRARSRSKSRLIAAGLLMDQEASGDAGGSTGQPQQHVEADAAGGAGGAASTVGASSSSGELEVQLRVERPPLRPQPPVASQSAAAVHREGAHFRGARRRSHSPSQQDKEKSSTKDWDWTTSSPSRFFGDRPVSLRTPLPDNPGTTKQPFEEGLLRGGASLHQEDWDDRTALQPGCSDPGSIMRPLDDLGEPPPKISLEEQQRLTGLEDGWDWTTTCATLFEDLRPGIILRPEDFVATQVFKNGKKTAT